MPIYNITVHKRSKSNVVIDNLSVAKLLVLAKGGGVDILFL